MNSACGHFALFCEKEIPARVRTFLGAVADESENGIEKGRTGAAAAAGARHQK